MDAPTFESERLRALVGFEILDTPPEARFDAITELAARVLDVPIALISFFDAERQWFKARFGLDVPPLPRGLSPCSHVVADRTSLVIPDASTDQRFANHPLVIGEPYIRFYAGVPLQTPEGHTIGVLCAIDRRAHTPSATQLEAMQLLAQQVIELLELRRTGALLRAEREAATERERQVAVQRDDLVGLQEQHDREADVARDLLHCMIERGQFDPERTRLESLTSGTFGGDVVFGTAQPDGRYRWLVGDVTGHTLASALVTIPISMVFYDLSERDMALPELVHTLDLQLRKLLPVSMFFAAVTCELDRARGTLTVINGGAPPVIVRRADGTLEHLESDQPPLGIAPSPPSVTVVPVAPGDRIYTFTDGLSEIANPDGALLGVEGVCAVLATRSGEDAFAALCDAWREHANADQTFDDDLSIFEVTV